MKRTINKTPRRSIQQYHPHYHTLVTDNDPLGSSNSVWHLGFRERMTKLDEVDIHNPSRVEEIDHNCYAHEKYDNELSDQFEEANHYGIGDVIVCVSDGESIRAQDDDDVDTVLDNMARHSFKQKDDPWHAKFQYGSDKE